MNHDVDAIYHAGVFQPLEPLPLAEGTRVHLRIVPEHAALELAEPERAKPAAQTVARLRSPRLANPDQIADFQMEVFDAASS